MNNNKLQKADKKIIFAKKKNEIKLILICKTSAADCNKITEKVLESKQTNVFENKLIKNYYAVVVVYLYILYIQICMCV